MSSMIFSDRVLNHPRIASSSPEQSKGPRVLAINDHLLVCETAWPLVRELLKGLNVPVHPLTTMFDGLSDTPTAGSENVRIVRLTLETDDIFGLMPKLRHGLKQDDWHKVSPNHVLIPAMEPHGCPWGPPHPISDAPGLRPALDSSVRVTVIDSGYQWDPRWGSNPLEDYNGPINESEADYVGSTGWARGIPDGLDADNDGNLDALAGHANFIAGVIAQGTGHASLTILNHNGGFDPTSDDLPTEASVALSLANSSAAQVIDLGFAFLTHGGLVSCAWDLAFNQLGRDAIVVAPAGNNSSPTPRFPAGFSYPNLLAVGSIDGLKPNGAPERSSFSNHGPWVKWSANGTDVQSTFLSVDMPVEEDPAAGDQDFTGNSWASWSGTSFATPKVVAALAEQLADGDSPAEAIQHLKSKGVEDPLGEVGVALPAL
jgi:thermitase